MWNKSASICVLAHWTTHSLLFELSALFREYILIQVHKFSIKPSCSFLTTTELLDSLCGLASAFKHRWFENFCFKIWSVIHTEDLPILTHFTLQSRTHTYLPTCHAIALLLFVVHYSFIIHVILFHRIHGDISSMFIRFEHFFSSNDWRIYGG